MANFLRKSIGSGWEGFTWMGLLIVILVSIFIFGAVVAVIWWECYKERRNQQRHNQEAQIPLANLSASTSSLRTRGLQREEIEELPAVNYSPSTEHDTDCSICIDEFRDGEQLTQLPCSHIFHPSCIGQYLQLKAVCPLCRGVVTSAAVETEASMSIANPTDVTL